MRSCPQFVNNDSCNLTVEVDRSVAVMSSEGEVFITSRSRTPSLIDVTSQNDSLFSQLPDVIQEAAVSTEFPSPNLRISRVNNGETIEGVVMTEPMFFIFSRTDSGIDMVDLNVTDEKVLQKFGPNLTANFADIKAYGSKAFFQKRNTSNGAMYSLCACATGYIWIYVTPSSFHGNLEERSEIEVQIGTFTLKSRAITTVEVRCQYRYSTHDDPLKGHLALLCSTVLGKYLCLRMMGQQYEYAAESAIKQSRKELSALTVVDPGRFGDFYKLLRDVCTNAPMPPTSDVSLISRSMITMRWQRWRETQILRKRYSLPQRALRSIRTSQYDSIDLLSDCFNALGPEASRLPILRK